MLTIAVSWTANTTNSTCLYIYSLHDTCNQAQSKLDTCTPCFFFLFSSSWLTHVDGMKDLWCSNTVRLLSLQIWMERSATSIDMNGSVCGALVQFGCYLHRHKWMSLHPIHIRRSLEVTCATHYIHQLYFSEGIFVISTLMFVFLSTNATPIPRSGLIYSLMPQLKTCLVHWLMELCIVFSPSQYRN